MENDMNSVKKSSSKLYMSLMLIVLVIIVGFLLLRGTTPPTKESAEQANNPFGDINIMPVSPDDHALGNPNAKVVIVEYSDTECPFCKRFHSDMHNLIANNSNVLWVYRHYPIASLHPKAFNEALATECAAEQGGNDAFWAYTDEVYSRTNSNNSLDPKELYKIASDINLDTLNFRTCLDTKQHTDIVEADMADGSKNKVQGTPTSFVLVNGKVVQVIPGALEYNQLAPLVDSLLQ